ncbi:MAG: PEP/pyruvate-binding domain-containing protein [Candidatus Altiarchaeota archaeon]
MAKTEWVLRWETVHPLHRMEAFFMGHGEGKVLGSDYSRLMGLCKDNVMHMYYSRKDLERKTRHSLKILQDQDLMRGYVESTIENYTGLIKLIRETIRVQKKLSNRELAERYGEVIRRIGILQCTYDLSRPEYFIAVEDKVREYLLSSGIGEERVNEVFSVLTTSTEMTLLDYEELDWLNMVLDVKKAGLGSDGLIQNRLAEHKRKYGWIGTSEQRSPWSISHYQELLSRDILLGKNELMERIKAKKTRKQQLRRRQSRLINRLDISEDIYYLLAIVRELAHLRLKIRFTWIESGFLMRKVHREISRRTGVRRGELEYYLLKDVRRLLLRKKKIDVMEVQNRKRYAFLLIKGRLYFYTGLQVCRLESRELVEADYSNINEVCGGVANPGIVSGRVKVINALTRNQEAEVRKMERGQILVTGMTRPHLIYAMKKASAIVTDEGGIASHAAILSRELGVPCVIGTRMATKIFKDGDYVLVDANKGIVRKITKKEIIRMGDGVVRRKPRLRTPKSVLSPVREERVVWLDELDRADVPSAGGKGANLGEMHSNFNVPNGFCVTTRAYRDFIIQNNIYGRVKEVLVECDMTDPLEVKKASRRIRHVILSNELSKELESDIISFYRKLSIKKVAVRSSATMEDMPDASFAGQHDTLLNVKGASKLINSVKYCWASLYTPRAIHYRESNRMGHDVLIAVVVQEMINPRYSGVMFTIDPIEAQQMLVEVVKGLGDKLVSGIVTPNEYMLNRKTLSIEKSMETFSVDQSLLRVVAKAGIRLERHYKYPQDVEFTIDWEGRLWILQSRPITSI